MSGPCSQALIELQAQTHIFEMRLYVVARTPDRGFIMTEHPSLPAFFTLLQFMTLCSASNMMQCEFVTTNLRIAYVYILSINLSPSSTVLLRLL